MCGWRCQLWPYDGVFVGGAVMGEWIKYDGANKPDGDALVRVRFPDGWESGPDDWERAGDWAWMYDPEGDADLISHFMIKPDQ